MIKELQYKGYATEPSDYECPDGQLATSLNLINEDEQLKPVFQPSCQATMPDGCKVVALHQNMGYKHYIISCDNVLFWIEKPETGSILTDSDFTNDNLIYDFDEITIKEIKGFGNTLIILTNQDIHYAYWTNGNYQYLGNKIPFVDMEFSLVSHFCSTQSKTEFNLVDKSEYSPEGAYNLVASISVSTQDVDDAVAASAGVNSYKKDIAITETLTSGYDYKIEYKQNAPRRYSNSVFSTAKVSLMAVKNGVTTTLDSKPIPRQGESVTFNVYIDEAYDSFYLHFFTSVRYYNYVTQIGGYIDVSQGFEVAVDTTKVIKYESSAYNEFMAGANKFVSEKGHEKNRFIFPFFVRYAVRLYDGTHMQTSEPILMTPNSFIAPVMIYDSTNGSSEDVTICAFCSELAYRFVNKPPTYWEDIIDGVDIFVSAPIYTYKQGQEFDPTKDLFKFLNLTTEANKFYTIGQLYKEEALLDKMIDKCLLKASVDDIVTSSLDAILIAPKTEEEICDNIRDNANFYHFLNIKLEQIETNDVFDVVKKPDGSLSSIQNRETLEENLMARRTFYDANATVYNNRLHIYDTSIVLPEPTHFARQNTITTKPTFNEIEVDVYIKTESGERIVKKSGSRINFIDDTIKWFFYPDPRAYKAVFKIEDVFDEGDIVAEIALKKHPFLSGAYALADEPYGYLNLNWINQAAQETEINNLIHVDNVIYVSEANNPFAFNPTHSISIPAKVLYLCAAVKALSQGQFGQFPLYAFTTEGVWALEVSATGSYSARQPISRDVCINPDSITQLDSAVLFATDRGIMLISGSQTQCISDSIFAEVPFDVTTLPKMEQLHAMLGDTHAQDACVPMQPFLKFLAGCQMLYDYVHQRIVVFNPTTDNGTPNYTYAYVFSLKSKAWGMMYSDLASTINSYPDALAMTHDNKLVSFSDTDEQVSHGLYITRPLKLEAADVHKTISALIQRGHFQRNDVATVLYGSRDLYNWRLIWSSKDHYLRGFRGTPYKYFRIAGLAALTDGKSIFGASINYEPRHINQLR